MASLAEDLDGSAAWISQALSSSGYPADFSPGSLWAVDRFFDDQSVAGRARPGGLLDKDLGGRLFAVGAYVGEVIRRAVGAQWRTDDQDPHGEVNVELVLPDGSTVWPVQRVMKRFKNGAEDGLVAYATALGVAVGPAPEVPTRRWWRRNR
ncbi:hypothetical protein [Hamadaea tsunoensis]|uniref:hypothetical protein n=1 Tax=Hamadaea tsunoensis TaxID=53368 RepID=UPI000428E37B|nr:hypothetical protein [Hamadaea tsunoensis]